MWDQPGCYADRMEEKVLPLLIPQPNHRSWQLLSSEATKTHSQGLAPFFWILHLKLKKPVTQGWPAETSWEIHPWLPLRSGLPSLRCPLLCAHTWEFWEYPLMTWLILLFCFQEPPSSSSLSSYPSSFPWTRGENYLYHSGDPLWTIHQKYCNIQLTDILRANKCQACARSWRGKDKIGVFFSYPSDQRVQEEKCHKTWVWLLALPGNNRTVAYALWASVSSSEKLVMGLDDLTAPSTSEFRCWRVCGYW